MDKQEIVTDRGFHWCPITETIHTTALQSGPMMEKACFWTTYHAFNSLKCESKLENVDFWGTILIHESEMQKLSLNTKTDQERIYISLKVCVVVAIRNPITNIGSLVIIYWAKRLSGRNTFWDLWLEWMNCALVALAVCIHSTPYCWIILAE